MPNKKNIETKILPSGDALRFFCVENKDNIVACGWYDTKYCLGTCKFYEKKQEEIKDAKYLNRGRY